MSGAENDMMSYKESAVEESNTSGSKVTGDRELHDGGGSSDCGGRIKF